MAVDTFLYRFTQRLDELAAHPRIRVTHVWVGSPATDASLAALAGAWGAVPRAIQTLYRQADGVQLRWVDCGSDTYHPQRDDVMQFQGPWRQLYEQPGRYVGLLSIPPIDDLLQRDIIGEMQDGEEDDPLRGAVSFDHYGESEDAVLYFADAPDDPWISVGEDYCAYVPPPGEQTLGEYLDRVLATWASTRHRRGEPPRRLDDLLRVRAPLDPSRVVGQRVVYMETEPDSVRMHGRVNALCDGAPPDRHWPYAPTLAEVDSDLGETVYVPLRALDPPDEADRYEALRRDPEALRRCLEGPLSAMFDALAAVTATTHGLGTPDGPVLMNHAWAYFALTTVFESAEAARLLFGAADRLYTGPDLHVAHPIDWPATRPDPPPRGGTVQRSTLAIGLFEAAVIHIGRAGPPDLPTWLGAAATSRLRQTLEGFRARNRLRGYDPLTDLQKSCGWLAAKLRGGPTAFETRARPAHRRGTTLGLADFRVVESS